MTSPPADRFRYERKYHAEDSSPQELELLLRTHPALFREVHPPRRVNNIYLDTPGLSSFSTHVHGAANRAKLRIRWYGDARGRIGRPLLEVKAKRGAVGSKHHYPVPPFEFHGSFDADALRRSAADRDDPLRALLASAVPALFNRYHRRYWCTADGRYRITVDTALEFHGITGHDLGVLGAWHERRLTVIELKYDVADEGGAHRVTASLPWRIAKVSKYVYGVERLSGLRG